MSRDMRVLDYAYIWMGDEARELRRLAKNPELPFPWPLIYRERAQQLKNVRAKIVKLHKQILPPEPGERPGSQGQGSTPSPQPERNEQ